MVVSAQEDPDIESEEDAINDASVQALRARFNGALLREGAEGYDTARKVWNGAIDRKPALIARCTGPSDVVEAVRFAREQGPADLGQRRGPCGRRARRR